MTQPEAASSAPCEGPPESSADVPEHNYGTSMHFPYCRDGRCTGCLPPFHGGQCACENCMSYDLDDGGWDMDPCNYCPHDNTDHRGDGCTRCGCPVSK